MSHLMFMRCVAMKMAVYEISEGNLLAAGVLGDCFGAFTDSMLG